MKCYRKLDWYTDFWVTSNEKYSNFFASSWQYGESPVPMLVIRILLALVALAILMWSVVEGGFSWHWFLYLTNWGLLAVCVMLISGIAVCSAAIAKPFTEGDGGYLPWYMSIYWFSFNVGISLSFMITALYWILLYDNESSKQEPAYKRLFWLDVATHGVNSMIAFTELIFARTPVYFSHFYQPLGVGLWYAFFSAFYFLCGGKDPNGFHFIYEILDWRHCRRSTVVVAASAAGMIVIYVLVWGFSLCRDKVMTKSIREAPTTTSAKPTIAFSVYDDLV